MERALFEEEVATLLPTLRSLSLKLIGNRDDAEDVLQDSLLRASKNLDAFRGESTLKTWLFSITTRTALDHLRASKRWSKQVMIDACDERGASSIEAKYGDPSTKFDVGEHIAFCFTCIGRSLDPEGHAALVLREVFHLENAEGARVLNLTEPTYRHALSAAREAMRTEYDGLCALVNKNGACYQCRALRELAPAAQKGPELPRQPMTFDERLEQVRAASPSGTKLNDYFFAYTNQMQRNLKT